MIRHLHAVHVGHWAGNLGDSAVFDVLDRALPPDVRLTVEAESVGDWRRRPQTSFLHWHNQQCIEQALTDCDEVIIPGTTVVTDLHDGDWPIAWVVKSIAAARSHKKRVYAVAVGVYPSECEARSERFINGFARAVDRFTVRDAASRDALLTAGVAEDRIILGADLAWLLDRKADEQTAQAEMIHLTGGRPALAVNVVHEDWSSDASFYESLAINLDRIHDEMGTTAVFFCNEIRAGELYDAAAARRTIGLMKTPAALCPPRWMHPEDMIARLVCCVHAVSMRYHFSVFASMAGIPWTGFARGRKNCSLLREFGRGPVLAMGGTVGGRLATEVLATQRERPDILRMQAQVVRSLQQRASGCVVEMRRRCDGGTAAVSSLPLRISSDIRRSL